MYSGLFFVKKVKGKILNPQIKKSYIYRAVTKTTETAAIVCGFTPAFGSTL